MQSYHTDEHVRKLSLCHASPARPVLQEIERQAKERDIPIVGPAVGRLFYQYAKLIEAKTVFEMGSAVGYSTIWWAKAVGEGGKVHYTDGSRKNADEARRYFDQAGVADRIEVNRRCAGTAVGTQRAVRHSIQRCRQARLSPRLQHGGAARAQRRTVHHRQHSMERQGSLRCRQSRLPKPEPDKYTEGVVELNRLLYSSPDWYTTIIPLRDGVAVAMRL